MSATPSWTSTNPATGRPIRTYTEHSPDDVEQIVRAASRAFVKWKTTSFDERAVILRAAAAALRQDAQAHAELMAQEMGKPVAKGRAEVEKCAWACDFYAEQGPAFLAPESISTDAEKSYVAFEPLGVVLAVMPWNFPFWQVFRFAAPGLMAGNAGLLKHASNVPGCALAIEAVFKKAGLPDGLFRAVLIGSDRVASLIEHPLIAAVTLTGSTPAGRAVASKAGSVLKKTVLELGGSDPYVVLEDADLAPTVEACAASRLINTGQSCIAAKRFIVVEAVRKRFEERLVEAMRERVMGDPMQEATQLGPMARIDLRDALHEQVQRSLKQGARLLIGGVIPIRPGAYYPATVLTDVRPGMSVFDEETFGPVAAIVPAVDEADAIRLANQTVFGLGASVFTKDVARGEQIAAKELEAGSCFVNAFVRSDPRLPFGGIKQSGYGRELSSFGIREFVNIKTVYVSQGTRTTAPASARATDKISE